MSMPASPKVVQIFLRVLRARGWIAGAFLVLAAAGIYGAMRVPDDPAIDISGPAGLHGRRRPSDRFVCSALTVTRFTMI